MVVNMMSCTYGYVSILLFCLVGGLFHFGPGAVWYMTIMVLRPVCSTS